MENNWLLSEGNFAKAAKVILEHIDDARCGIFKTRNTVGDPMETIYSDDEITIDICYGWEYFEVFGLTDAEFKDLRAFYDALRYSKTLSEED